MYRSCIFCSAPLGSNESIERFPVGRSLAFDGAKGRLWAVCGTCARWNLAPLDERWEAIDEAERLFRDTRTRVQRENIGLAKLRDGTRLVRVGQAIPGELAAWRYGESLVRRRRRYLAVAAPLGVMGASAWLGLIPGAAPLAVAGVAGILGFGVARYAWDSARASRPVMRLAPGEAPVRVTLTVYPEHLLGARMVVTDDGGIGVRLLDLRHRPQWSMELGPRGKPVPAVVAGDRARHLLNRAMVLANHRGAGRDGVLQALDRIAGAGGPAAYLHDAARERHLLLWEPEHDEMSSMGELFSAAPVPGLAVEMALHEETERRALDGELAMLEGMWREAEQIAAIADRLPDVDAEPPRPGVEA